MHLLCECDGSIVVRKLAVSSRVGRPQADAVVDVQDAGRAARRPDNSGGLDVVLLGVYLTVGEIASTLGAHAGRGSLAGILGEVVAGDKVAGDALVKTRPAMVGCGHDGVLEATWVLQVQVQLAGTRVVLGGDTGADVGLELVESVGDDLVIIVRINPYLLALLSYPCVPKWTDARTRTVEGACSYRLIGRRAGRDGALGAAVARVRRVDDGDLRWVRGGSRTGCWDRVRDSEKRKEKSGDLGMHGDFV